MLPFFQQLLSTYGYWIVALGVMAESMGLPFPGETLLLLGAASAGAGYLDIWGVISAAAGGALVGDTLGYELGRWGGRPLLERYGPIVHLKPHHLARAEAFVARYGTKAVFFGRFIAILRTYSAFLAGVSRLPYPRFLLCNAAGGLLWALTFGWLGAAFGSQWPLIQLWAGRAGLLMLGLLGLVALAVLLGGPRSRRTRGWWPCIRASHPSSPFSWPASRPRGAGTPSHGRGGRDGAGRLALWRHRRRCRPSGSPGTGRSGGQPLSLCPHRTPIHGGHAGHLAGGEHGPPRGGSGARHRPGVAAEA